jgi:hypothetical protein
MFAMHRQLKMPDADGFQSGDHGASVGDDERFVALAGEVGREIGNAAFDAARVQLGDDLEYFHGCALGKGMAKPREERRVLREGRLSGRAGLLKSAEDDGAPVFKRDVFCMAAVPVSDEEAVQCQTL